MFFVEAAVATTEQSNYQSISDFWLFVVYCLVVIVVVIFFSFYFNRVLGQVVTFLINQYTWRRYNAYIEVDSIRVSVLGGRILFKNLRYLSTNQSISILKGHVTVQYWLLNVRKSEDDKNGKASNLPCRIACSFEGLEWFFYNNTPAYNRMKDILGLSTTETSNSSGRPISEIEKLTDLHGILDPENQIPINVDTSLMERLLPIQFECTEGAVMIGNTELKSMLVVKTTQANGIYSITKSRSSLDYYKSVVDVILRKPQFSLKDNMDYATIEKTVTPIEKFTLLELLKRPLRHLYPFAKTRQYGKMQHMHSIMREGGNQHSQGSDTTTYHEEYARVMNIVECNEMALTYYADYAGPVPAPEAASTFSGNGIDIGNGGLPPEWGIRISVWDATVHYGPWADRQRSEMQDYFFPNSHRGNTPTPRLLPGQQRVATVFETYIEFMNEGKLRIPTREKSKDWKYNSGVSELDIGSDGYYTRPYGWFNVKAGEGSYVKVTTPFVCGPTGLSNVVDVVLKDTDISTSVNYASFLQSNRIEIHIDMPAPLQWNGYRHWNFKINARRPIIFLLRDHIYLLQDMIKDWTSSQPADLLHFTPITYQLQFSIEHPTAYLCVNEHNIINYPNSIEDNAYFKIQSQRITFDVILPFTEFQPETTSIKFHATAEQSSAGLSLQTSHTFASFMREDDANTAVAVNISIDGTYEAYSTVDILRHIESCNLHLKINGATVKMFGTLIRYVLILKDNYFGAWNNFSTIDEYRRHRSNHQEWLEQKKKQADAKPLADPFEVYLLLELEDGVILTPENLYECSSYSQVEFQELQLELRNLDVYLDMYLNISPITISRNSNPNTQSGSFRIKRTRDPNNYVYVDGFNLYGHRLFGPLPECATYLCQWDLDIGRIVGEVKPSFLLGLACFGQTFAYNLIDEDNAVPQEMKSKDLPDVTFVKLFVREVDVSLMSMSSATNISLKDGILLEFDNLINSKYSQRITIKMPTILTRFLANPDYARGATLSEAGEYSWVEVAKADLGLNITIFRHTAMWRNARSKQQNFIRTQDYPTRRCVRLYEEADTNSQVSLLSSRSLNEHHVGVLYAPPFRPFMFGRVEDKSVFYDSNSYSDNTPSSERIQYANQGSTGSISSLHSSSLSDILQNDYEQEDYDDVSYKTYSVHSGVSRDNDSFHTAKGSVYEDVLSNDFSDDNFSIISQDESGTTSDEDNSSSSESTERARNRFNRSPETNLAAAIPPSIPYSDYLRRYKVKRSYTEYNHGEFFYPFIPPSHSQFIPEKDFEKKKRPAYEELDNNLNDYFQTEDNEFSQNDNDAGSNGALGNGNGNEVIATTVVEATKPMTALVTPILIKIVQELAEEIIKDDWDLESMLDALQMSYIEQLTRFLTNQFICSRFAVILPQTYLHFIQNVTVPDNLPSYKHGESFIKTQYNPEDTILCSADVFFNGFKMIGSVKFEDYAYNEKKDKVAESNLKLQELRLHIDVEDMGSTVQYVSKQYDRQSFSFGIPYEDLRNKKLYSRLGEEDIITNELNVLDLAVSGFSFKLLGARTPNYAELTVKSIDSIIITESVEILVGAVYSWLIFVDDLKGILESFQDKRKKQVQVFIHEIANFSLTQGVVGDPIFLTTPSTMLRLGSRNFRNDCGWKILARMRHCLRSMPASTRDELQGRLTSGGSLEAIKTNEMYSNVVETFSHWRSWEVSYDDITHCRLFSQPFEQKRMEQGENTGKNLTDEAVKFLMTASNFAKIRLGSFKFTIYEEETTRLYKEENSISVGPFEFLLECLFKKSPISSIPENLTLDNQQKITSTADGYVDIITRINLGTIHVSVNPIIMAFARHMILVQRVFTDKILNLQHATKLSKVANSQKIQDASQVASSAQETVVGNQDFDFGELLGKIDVVAQALISLDKIQVVAHAHDLRMDANVFDIQGSALFSNPKLAPLQLLSHADRDSDTGSGKRSSTRGRKTATSDPRLVLEAACGINLIDINFGEDSNLNTGAVPETFLNIMLNKANVNANISQVSKSSKKYGKPDTTKDILNVFSNIHGFRIHIPQSLLKLYGFVESWQAEQASRFQFLFQNLVKEWEDQRREQGPSSTAMEYDRSVTNQPAVTNTKKMDLKLQFLLNEFLIQADLLPSLSAEYNILNFFVMVNETHQKSLPVHMYSFQLSKQVIRLITKDSKNTLKEDTINTFSIPGIHSTGSLKSEVVKDVNQKKLRSLISVAKISMSLDASLIDSILTAQSLLGNEISELIDVLSYSKPKKELATQSVASVNKSTGNHIFKYSVDVSLEGLSISASSPSAICIFASNLLEASLSNDSTTDKSTTESFNQLTWKLQARNFSLSLDHNIAENIDDDPYLSEAGYRRNCLAYILIDFCLQNYLPICSTENCSRYTHIHKLDKKPQSIFVDISRIQTVMQPIALGKLAEMYIYYDSELRKKKMMKKDEIDQLAANTKIIVSRISNQDDWQKTLQEESQSLLKDKIISVHIRRIGVAIPLDTQFDLPSTENSKGIGALLLSITSIEFLSKSIEKGALQLDSVTLQFVKKFDQNKSDHFFADNHPRMNHITFPSVSCHVSATNNKPLQRVKADASIRGFDIDIDGTIADYLNTLSVIYIKCKDRVDAFTAQANFSLKNDLSSPSTLSKPSNEHKLEVVNLDIECAFICDSGVIRMYPKKHSGDAHRNKKKAKAVRARGIDVKINETNMASVELPGLSAWCTYQTSLGAHASTTDTPKRFHCDVLIRESKNTLHPALVQFLREVTAGLTLGIQQTSERKAVQNAASVPELNMNTSLFLRLSRTQLDLTCQPSSKVVCSLGWEESEFLMNAFSNDNTSRTISCVGSVRTITAVVKHHFSPEPCLNARVDRILFNAMLNSQRQGGKLNDDISITIDIPDVLGDINMRHLQDYLILHSCWLDQPIVSESEHKGDSPKSPIPSSSNLQVVPTAFGNTESENLVAQPCSSPFSKHIALLIRKMKFSADLGQNIGKITFIPSELSFQAHYIPFDTKGISLSLDDIKIVSEGRLSGNAEFKRTVIQGRVDQSVVNSDHKEKASGCVRSDGFSASFEYEYQNILDTIQQSLELNVDYRRVSNNYELQVSIILEALIARLSVKTVPVIITMVQKFNELLQKKKAEAGIRSDIESLVSKQQKRTVVVKPQEHTKNSTYESSSIQSQVLLLVKAAEVVIYPSQFQDTDNVDMRAKQLKVDLQEFPRTAAGVQRDLTITIATAALAKNVPGKELMVRYSAPLPPASTKPKNLGGTKIFGIPGTKIVMESTQVGRDISHTFNANFEGRIGVSLNLGLIKYLQEMINMFKYQLNRALDKNHNGADLHTPLSMSSTFEENEDGSLSVTSSRRPSMRPESLKGSSTRLDSDTAISVSPSPSTEAVPVEAEVQVQAEEKPVPEEKYTYTSLNTVNFQPQLQVMGDATPPVEWFGFKRERIPGLLHENLTLHLDKVIEVIWNILQSQAD